MCICVYLHAFMCVESIHICVCLCVCVAEEPTLLRKHIIESQKFERELGLCVCCMCTYVLLCVLYVTLRM